MSSKTQFIIYKTVAFCLLSLVGCSTYDFGDGGTYKIEVPDEENPEWERGVSEIVALKCATCHTEKSPWYKPKNVPAYPNASNPNFGLNNISLQAFFDLENPLVTVVKRCIETTCTEGKNDPMPPNYATQLTEGEKKALLNFVKPFVKAVKSDLSESFKSTCGGCHGADGRSGFAPKLGDSPYDLQQFKQIIQNGTGGMKPQPGYDIGKAEADHKLLYK